MITVESLASQIKSLEAQIAVLKAQLERLQGETEVGGVRLPSGRPIKSFADLYGIFADAGDITEEEIDAVLYRINEDDEELCGEPE
jgi:hypothetical protein